jgi:hypothetical protein
VPRRSRRRIVGKWERVEQEAREEELAELERELHGERRGGRPKPKHRRRPTRKPKPDAPKTNTERDSGTDSTASDD